MLMDLGMKSTSNCGYMHYTIAVSLEMTDEPEKKRQEGQLVDDCTKNPNE